MDNIVLLDLDGVLITTQVGLKDKMHEDGYSDFNPICVANLNKILKDTGYDIVLSSMRRTKVDIDLMNKYFEARGVAKPIIAYTQDWAATNSIYYTRRREIELFLEEHKPNNYLILDDDKSLSGASEEIKDNWIQTQMMTGL